MIQRILTLLFIIISISNYAQIPNGYYDDAQGLSGSQLKTALFEIINDHNIQSYTSLWLHFEQTDVKANGKVWDMYSDIPGGTPPYEYNFGDDQCGNYNSEADCYNREHSFPKSWFNDASPMYSDLFQIVPTDGYVNGMRSNYPYGEVGSATWTSMNGSKLGNNSTSGYSGVVFEPIDDYKGDFARIYFYMATRYEDRIASWENNTTNSDAALDGTTFPCYEEWFLDILLEWHQSDPVSQKEIDRNNEVYDIQNNRNPFVDHPEYVNMVWGGITPPTITNITWSPNPPQENEEVDVSATITDNGSVSSAILEYGFSSTSLSESLNMSASSNTYAATIPGQSAGTNVYFRISATDNESNMSQSAIYSYQVAENAGTISLPFLEDFNDQSLGIFYQISVSGPDQYWHNDDYNGTYYAKMSNYNGSSNLENEDWLITPAINFNNYSGEILEFQSSMMNYDDFTTEIYLKYSTDYSGSGNPNNASWTDISNQADWSEGNYTWIESGEIDLSGITGNSVYIAFVYDSQSGSGKTWQIDDVSISIDNNTNTPPNISNISFQPAEPEENEIVLVSATITDNIEVSQAKVFWGYSASNLNQNVNMNSSGDVFSASIPGQTAETTVYFKITATDNENESSSSQVFEYTIQSLPNTPPVISNIDYMPEEPQENEAVQVSATITDNELVSLAEVIWGYSASNLSQTLNMSASGDHFQVSIPGQMEETTVFFKIRATDNEDEVSISDLFQYTVLSNPNEAPQISNINFTPAVPEANEAVSVSCNITDDNQVALAQIKWGFTSNSMTNTVNMGASGNTYSGNIPGQDAETIIYFRIQATDDESSTSISNTFQYQVAGISNLPPQISSISYSPENPFEMEEVEVVALINDDNEVAQAILFWGYSESNLSNQLSMQNDGNEYSALIPGQNADITVFFRVTATDNDDESTTSAIYQYSVQAFPNEPPLIENISFGPNPPEENEIVLVEAIITDDQNVATAQVHWGYTSSNLVNTVNMTHSGDDYQGEIPGQTAETTVYFKITATDNENESSSSQIFEYTVQSLPNTPPVISNIDYTPEEPQENEGVQVSATITDNELVSLAEVIWGYSASNLSQTLNMSASGDHFQASIPGQLEETTVYFKIRATDNEDEVSISDLFQYTVLANPNGAPEINNMTQFPMEPNNTDEVTISAEITDDGEIDVAELQFGTSPTELNQIIDMTANNTNFIGIIPPQDANQFIYYRIYAIDNEGTSTYSQTLNYYVDLAEGIQITENSYNRIYPNPAQQTIRIESSINEGDVFIYSASGELISSFKRHNTGQSLNIESLNRGYYIIKLVSKNEVISLNLVVN